MSSNAQIETASESQNLARYVLTDRFLGLSWSYDEARAGAPCVASNNHNRRPMSQREAESFLDFEARGVDSGLGGSGQMDYRLNPRTAPKYGAPDKAGALTILRALLETVRECGGVSSYELFKATQGKMTLGNFLAFVAILKNGGLIVESGGVLRCPESGTKPA